MTAERSHISADCAQAVHNIALSPVISLDIPADRRLYAKRYRQEEIAMDNDLLARLAALPDMTAPELKKLWRELHKDETPPFNRVYYVKKLAYHMQELAYGVDSRRVEKRLEAWSRQHQDAQGRPTRKSAPTNQPIAGTRLVREYGGEEHVVTAMTQGSNIGARPIAASRPSPAPLPAPRGRGRFSSACGARTEATGIQSLSGRRKP